MILNPSTFYFIVYSWIAVALVIFPLVLWVVAPYGRHTSTHWGPLINNKLGWILMELPALFFFAYFFLYGSNHHTFIPWIFFSLWLIHYICDALAASLAPFAPQSLFQRHTEERSVDGR